MTNLVQTRLSRSGIEAEASLSPAASVLRDRTWLAMTSSHLGRSTRLHAEVCRYISCSMIDARRRGHVVLIAADSAIEPWASRAAELFSVPIITVRISDQVDAGEGLADGAAITVNSSGDLSRDAVVVALADRVDCVFARPNGNVESSLLMRLGHRREPTTRVAVHTSAVDKRAQKVARELMNRGAVGWYCRSGDFPDPSKVDADRNVQLLAASLHRGDWAKAEGEWIVHCTRACAGRWPGQTERQHRDELLLGHGAVTILEKQTPFDSLRRIARMRRIVASAIASDHAWPVVCFSAQPIAELLSRRRYRSHLHRWDYEPYGIAIRKSAAIAAGFQPVIYGSADQREALSTSDRYRFQAIGKTYDWTQEQEWRCHGDVNLDRFDPDDVRLFVRDVAEARRLASPYQVCAVDP